MDAIRSARVAPGRWNGGIRHYPQLFQPFDRGDDHEGAFQEGRDGLCDVEGAEALHNKAGLRLQCHEPVLEVAVGEGRVGLGDAEERLSHKHIALHVSGFRLKTRAP